MSGLEGRAPEPGAAGKAPERSAAVEQQEVAALARAASVEMTWRDVDQLESCRASLPPGAAVFASHLPRQTWQQTLETCVAIRDRGFERVRRVGQGILPERAGRGRRGLGQHDARRHDGGGDSCGCLHQGPAGEIRHDILPDWLHCAAASGVCPSLPPIELRLQTSRARRPGFSPDGAKRLQNKSRISVPI